MSVLQLRKALRQHRLDRHWSFERLSAEIGPDYVTGRTLRRFIEGAGEPRGLTVRVIEAYLTRSEERVAS